jgi:hypothetical protein
VTFLFNIPKTIIGCPKRNFREEVALAERKKIEEERKIDKKENRG